MASTTYNGFINYQSATPRWRTIYQGSSTATTGKNYCDSETTYSTKRWFGKISNIKDTILKLRITFKYQFTFAESNAQYTYYNNRDVTINDTDVHTVTVTLDDYDFSDATYKGRIMLGTSWRLSGTGLVGLCNLHLSDYSGSGVDGMFYLDSEGTNAYGAKCVMWITKIERYY